MRSSMGFKVAVIGGSASLLLAAAAASAQIVNPEWNLPNSNSTPPDNSTGTDTTAQTGSTNTPGLATGWYLSPAANPDFGYTNPGDRDQFYSVEPIVPGRRQSAGVSGSKRLRNPAMRLSQLLRQIAARLCVTPASHIRFRPRCRSRTARVRAWATTPLLWPTRPKPARPTPIPATWIRILRSVSAETIRGVTLATGRDEHPGRLGDQLRPDQRPAKWLDGLGALFRQRNGPSRRGRGSAGDRLGQRRTRRQHRRSIGLCR